MLYRFAKFTLDTQRSLLTRSGEPVPLARKAVDMLAVLVRNAGELTTKAQLMDALWPDGFVEESNLTQHVYLLRRTLKQYGIADAIQTVPCRGYRFTVPVETAGPAAARRRFQARYVAACAAVCLLAILASAFPASHSAQLRASDRRLYELGRYYWSLRTVSGLHRSVAYFSKVAGNQPQSALGYAGLSDAYLGLFDYECDGAPCARYARLSRENAQKAAAIDSQSAPAHTSLAMTLRVFDRNYARSDVEFRRAIALDPQYALAHEWYGNSLLLRGRIGEAREELETAALLQPVAPATYGWLARAEYYSHRFQQAIAYAREALALDPSRAESRLVLGLSYAALGDRTRAIRTFRRLNGSTALIAGVEAARGACRVARALISRSKGDDVDAALAFVALHDYASALSRLRRARFAGEIDRKFLAMDPRLDAVRGDARFRPWTS